MACARPCRLKLRAENMARPRARQRQIHSFERLCSKCSGLKPNLRPLWQNPLQNLLAKGRGILPSAAQGLGLSLENFKPGGPKKRLLPFLVSVEKTNFKGATPSTRRPNRPPRRQKRKKTAQPPRRKKTLPSVCKLTKRRHTSKR